MKMLDDIEQESSKIERKLKTKSFITGHWILGGVFALIIAPMISSLVNQMTLKLFDKKIDSGVVWLLLSLAALAFVIIRVDKLKTKYNKRLSAINQLYQKLQNLLNKEQREAEEEEKQRIFAKRLQLMKEKYGEEDGVKIAKHEKWVGMTADMLVDSIGSPRDKKESVYKTKTKENWYYKGYTNNQGNVTYRLRIDLEDGVVVGWKDIN